MIPGRCEAPGRWVLDALALELAEARLDDAREALWYPARDADMGVVLDRYIAALEARNALRDGAP